MQEYVSDALVLRKDSSGDQDGRYACFTERFGKLWGRAKSSRKITSKLAPHLEPGTIVKMRFVESGGTQIVDALKKTRLTISLLDLQHLYQMLPDGQPEPELWNIMRDGAFLWTTALAILGWDPRAARCAQCGREEPEWFWVSRQEFFCRIHASKLPRAGVIFLKNVPV